MLRPAGHVLIRRRGAETTLPLKEPFQNHCGCLGIMTYTTALKRPQNKLGHKQKRGSGFDSSGGGGSLEEFDKQVGEGILRPIGNVVKGAPAASKLIQDFARRKGDLAAGG